MPGILLLQSLKIAAEPPGRRGGATPMGATPGRRGGVTTFVGATPCGALSTKSVGLSSSAAIVLLVLSLSACTDPYTKFMQEGQKLRDGHQASPALESFRKAAAEARKGALKDPKKTEKLIAALQAEKDAALDSKQKDVAMNVLEEICRILENNSDYKKASKVQAQMALLAGDADCHADRSNFDFDPTPMNFYQAALGDLKSGQMEASPEAADIYAGISDYYSNANNLKVAAEYMEKSCKILDKIKYNENDRNHGIYLHKLSYLYGQLNRDDEAEALEEKAKTFDVSGLKNGVDGLRNMVQ